MPENAEQVAADISALLRARNPLLWIVTREEARAEGYLFEAAAAAGYRARTWDVAAGVAEMDGTRNDRVGGADPFDTLNAIEEAAKVAGDRGERFVWIMRDLAPWLGGPTGLRTNRVVRNLARLLPTVPRATAQAIIVLSTSGDVPPELAGHATVIEWPMPDRAEIARLLDAAIDNLPDEYKAGAAPNGIRDAAIDAAVGLSAEEASACYARSLVQFKRIDPPTVAREKRRVIARERVLEWFDPLPGGLDAVGGLDVLKGWLASRKEAFSPAAREYGLPAPRGILLVGPPGTGKSLTAKAVSTAWGVPLLRLDLGALKSKYVGESEGNLRRALRTIEAIGQCVVWLDEIEKSLAGATQGAADGGVSSDALGAILSWMQDRPAGAFIVATANAADQLPPELTRAGRFDQTWFIDLPNSIERRAVFRAALAAHGRAAVAPKDPDWGALVDATRGFTGAEIAATVPDALYRAFSDGARELTPEDLLKAAASIVPVSKSAGEKIEALRAWAKERARPATTPEEIFTDQTARGRVIDL